MSPFKWTIGMGVVVGLLGLGFAWRERTAARREAGELVLETRACQSSLAELHGLQRQNEQAKSELAELERIGASGRATPAPGAANSGGGGPGGAAGQAGAAAKPGPRDVNWELSRNPAVRAALSGWIKGNLNVGYGPLFKSLGFSAAQIEAFENLMLEGNIVMGPGATLTLRPEGETLAQVGQEMQALLGPDGFQQYTQYQRSVFVREVASGLAGSLYDTPTPLTPQQGEQLTQILAQNNTLPPLSGPPFPGTIAWEGVYAQAQAVLSAPQLAALQNEGTIISTVPGLWGALNPLMPGSIGNTSMPPGGFYVTPAPKK